MKRVVITGLGIVSSIGNNAEEVLAALTKDDGVTYIGLVLNRRGLDRALFLAI